MYYVVCSRFFSAPYLGVMLSPEIYEIRGYPVPRTHMFGQSGGIATKCSVRAPGRPHHCVSLTPATGGQQALRQLTHVKVTYSSSVDWCLWS